MIGYYLYWLLSLSISAAGVWLWVKIITRVDPTWKAKEHKWVLYILAGVGSFYLSYVFYYMGFFFWGNFYTAYEAADDFWYYILVNGPSEEWGKFVVFWILAKGFKRVKEPRDGVLVAMMVALGFSFWENIQYILIYGLDVVPTRLLWASSGHMAYAAVWGYFGGQMILEPPDGGRFARYRYLLASVFVAAFVHGMFNFLVSWVSFGAGLFIDLLAYIVTLIILSEVCRIPSGYTQFAVKDARKAVPAILAAMERDPENPILKRRLGFYNLALGNETEALKEWMSIPLRSRNPYLNAWIVVLATRNNRATGVGYQDRNGGFEKHLSGISSEGLSALERRLRFYLKNGADDWILRVDAAAEQRRIRALEAVWR